jgi:probable HAF family extracellular repeat protein
MNAIPDPFSLIYLPLFGSSNGTQARAFLWQDGTMQDLGTLGGQDANAFGLNERGQVIGISYTNSTPNPATKVPTLDPFLWTKDKGMIDLGTLGGTSGGPNALNNRGQVIGASNLAGDQISDPFLWNDGKLIDLFTNTIGGNPVTANAINDVGEIVGGGAFSNRVFDAYLWRNGAASDLGTLNGDCFSEAIAINSRGQVVGNSVSCDGSRQRSFLWEKGLMVDLNTLIPPNSALELVETLAINDGGEVTGNGVPPGCGDVNACGHAFVLIPCNGDQADTEGCNDGGEVTGAVSQNSAASVNQSATTVTQGSPTAREIAARIHARIGRRFHVPGLAPGPTR